MTLPETCQDFPTDSDDSLLHHCDHYDPETVGKPVTRYQDILIVEDNVLDQTIIHRALQRAGVAEYLYIAGDGASALRILGLEPAPLPLVPLLPSLILLDLMLPGIDGLTVLERLRRDPRTRAIPVIVFTSIEDRELLGRCMELGIDGYFLKPFRCLDFAEAVVELIEQSRTTLAAKMGIKPASHAPGQPADDATGPPTGNPAENQPECDKS